MSGFISRAFGLDMNAEAVWAQSEQEMYTAQVAQASARARRNRVRPTQRESTPVAKQMTQAQHEFREKLCRTLKIETTASSAELLAAVDEVVGARNRAKLLAADQAGSMTQDAFYKSMYPSANAKPVDALEGLSAEDAATYRACYPTDGTADAAEPDSDEAAYRKLFPDEG